MGRRKFVKKSEKEPKNSDYTAIHVKRDGKWLLDRVSEEESPVIFSNYDRLKDLEWMIGDWVDQDDRSSVEMNVQMDQESDVHYAAVCHFHRGSTGHVRNSAHRLGPEHGKNSLLGVRFRRGFRRSDLDQERQSLDYQCRRDDA